MSPSVSLVVLSVRKDWLLVNLLSRSASQVLYVKKRKHPISMLNIRLVLVVSCSLCGRYDQDLNSS